MSKEIGQIWGDNQPKGLTNGQLIMIELKAQGIKYAEIARRLSSGEFEDKVGPGYSVKEQTLKTWAQKPEVRAALQRIQAEQMNTLVELQSFKMLRLLPAYQEGLERLLPLALDGVARVLNGEHEKGGQAIVSAAQLVFKYLQVTEERVVSSTETEKVSKEGLSSDMYENLRRVLVGKAIYGKTDISLRDDRSKEAGARANRENNVIEVESVESVEPVGSEGPAALD